MEYVTVIRLKHTIYVILTPLFKSVLKRLANLLCAHCSKQRNLFHKSKHSQLKQRRNKHTIVTMPSFQIQDSVAFITGTNKARGIGRAVIDALIENGARKVYATARNTSQLDDLVAKYNGKVVAVTLVVTDLDAIAALPETYPDVTLVVNNSGYFGGSNSVGDLEAAKNEFLVNYLAPLAIGKAFSSVFAKAKAVEGSDVKPTAFININSIASFVNFPIGGTYSASKAAAHSLTQAQRRDLSNTLVIGVYPGPIDTDMADGISMDKTPPSTVATEIVEALQKGTEDVFPDPTAVQLYEGWKADAKALEKQMAASASA
jgi:NAD(P)-dependent dehydrogenase (short-subunit alcohol dehydrogenase family)